MSVLRSQLMRLPVREKTIRKYMLGELEQGRRRRLERKLLTDAEFFERVSVVENEVIYDYLIGAISEREAKQLEANFLSTPEGQQKLRFLGALKKSVEGLPEPAPPLPLSWKRLLPDFLRQPSPLAKTSGAFAALLIAVAATWLLLGVWNKVGPSPSPQSTLVATLVPGQFRGTEDGTGNHLTLQGDVGLVELRLQLRAADRQTYRAELLTDLSEKRLQQDGLTAGTGPEGKFVAWAVPPGVLEGGDYQVALSSLRPDGSYEVIDKYYFRVLRR